MHGFIPGRLDRITAHLNHHYIEREKIAGCQLLVARAGEIAYQREFGLADRERGKPLARDTIFRIYSMTKPITSVALMTLFEEGRFRLSDPVSSYFPEWRDQRVWVSGEGDQMMTEAAKRPVTIRDMLSHTGGLTYGNVLATLGAEQSVHPVDQVYRKLRIRRERDETAQDLARKLGQVPLRYQPGERWMYSLSTDVCGALVEAISGMSFDRFLAQRIFEPLGMRDTSFSVPTEKLSRLAACYRRGAEKRLELADDPQTSSYREHPRFLSGGGGLTSTIADYYRFAEMLRRGGELDGVHILAPRTLHLMRQNHLQGGQDLTQLAIGAFSETANEGVGFGLGFASTVDPVAAGSLSSGEFYWGGAASTIFWVDPQAELVVIFMTQLIPSRTFDFRAQLKSLIYSALDE
ncbi:MAG TPA: serine hydrolase domain-containing protein [Polyangiales bacterium]|nr:serine hydrolase domain-containing protein [Polyangiales bacterium]